MVHHVIGRVAETVERTGRMELARRTSQHIYIGPDALDPGRIEEIGGADAFSNNVPIISAGHVIHLLLLHQLQQLVADAAHSHHGLSVDVVSLAPRHAVLGSLPLQKHIEVGQMVALGDREVRVDVVRLFFVLGGTVEDLRRNVEGEPTLGTESMATMTTISAVQPIFSAITIIFCRYGSSG